MSQPERSAAAKAIRVARRARTALHRALRGIPARDSRVVFPEVKNDLYQAHRAVYGFAGDRATDRVVLDAGCGTGYGSRELVAKGAARVIGVDRDSRMIAYASRRFGAPAIDFLVGDIEKPIDTDWDVAVAAGTLPYVEDFEAAISSLARGRSLVASVPPVVDEWSMAVDRVNRYADHHFYVLYWAALLDTAFGTVRCYRLRPPEGVQVDLRSPFPSRVEARDFVVQESDLDGLAADPGVLVVLVGERG